MDTPRIYSYSKKTPALHQYNAMYEAISNPKGIIWLPTGTGKSYIQALIMMEDMRRKAWTEGTIPVYVVISPRIILATQLFEETRNTMEEESFDCQYLIVHSGTVADKKEAESEVKAIKSEIKKNKLPYREVVCTTSSKVIESEYERALRDNVPLIISSTYDSAKRIMQSGIPVTITHCDEAHTLLRPEFQYICNDFRSTRKYFYTATLKETFSNEGIGMNNPDRFGGIIFERTPLQMICAGVILRPRMHIVDMVLDLTINPTDIDIDTNAVISAFEAHKGQMKKGIGAKMLVSTSGTERLNDIMNHPRMIALRDSGVDILDITSFHKPRINGEKRNRNVFLDYLCKMKKSDEAIILHVRILTEGIDVPGITGVMIMNMTEESSLSTFLQTLGRATRLELEDGWKLRNNLMSPHELDKFNKPYAYVIIPVYRSLGIDNNANISRTIFALRRFGFNPREHVVISESHGVFEPPITETTNEIDAVRGRYIEELIEMTNTIEAKAVADQIDMEQKLAAYQIDVESKNMTREQRRNSFSDFA